ncbi:MAG: prephenate dehydratase [Clostridia bacterium]
MEKNPLLEVRDEIDAIDKELLPLFIARMKCSEKVAKIKIEKGIPVLNAVREQEIIEQIRLRAGNYGTVSASIYASIMALSRQLQQEMMGENENYFSKLIENSSHDIPKNAKILCQGVQGAYSHKAALEIFKDGNISFCPKFENVFTGIENGEFDFGVIPVENSAAGSVNETYSLIMQYRYYIVSAIKLSVNHCLAAKKGSIIRTVISHPQALMQCGDYISQNSFERKEFSNTAAAAEFVSKSEDENIAAICSKEAAEKYGLEILKEGIQDDKNNHTRFAVISKNPILTNDADKISLCFSLPHETGSLFTVLQRFSLAGLNLSKIESRPIKGSNFNYDFYLDFQGNIVEKQVSVLLSQLKDELIRFDFLGNYKEL